MTEHGPDKDNRRNRIEQGEQEAAVEGGRRPQRRRCFKPEGALTLSARIAKEPLDPIEEFGQPFRIEPCREIAPGKARAQRVIILPLKRSFRRRPLRKNAELIFINERSGENAKTSDLVERRLRWALLAGLQPGIRRWS